MPASPIERAQDRASEGGKPIPCGGCGATSDAQRCIGCLHDFGDEASSWVKQHAFTPPHASSDHGATGDHDLTATERR